MMMATAGSARWLIAFWLDPLELQVFLAFVSLAGVKQVSIRLRPDPDLLYLRCALLGISGVQVDELKHLQDIQNSFSIRVTDVGDLFFLRTLRI
jgi:hypothetical protein